MIEIQKIYSTMLAARQHIKRGGWAAIEGLVAPILLIALSPWLLQRLGATGFGQWALALAISGFAHLASLGSGVSTMYAVSASAAKNMIDEGVDAIRAGLLVTLVSALILVIISWMTAETVAISLFSKMGETSTVANVLMLGVWALALQQIDDVFAGALRGMQRYDLVASLELVTRPLWALCIALAALEYNSIIAVLAAHIAVNLIKTIIRARMVMMIFRMHLFEISVPLKNVLAIVNFGKWVSLQSVGGVLFATMDKVLVGWIFGGGELARYSICIQIAQFIHNLQASALQVITPWIMRKKISKLSSDIKIDFLRIALWSGIACMVLPLLLFISSWYILKLWMGEIFAINNVDLLRVLLVGSAILAFTIPAYYMILGFGRAKFSAILLFAAGLFSILGSVALASFGLVAFSGGRLIYGLVAFLYLLRLRRLN